MADFSRMIYMLCFDLYSCGRLCFVIFALIYRCNFITSHLSCILFKHYILIIGRIRRGLSTFSILARPYRRTDIGFSNAHDSTSIPHFTLTVCLTLTLPYFYIVRLLTNFR